MTSHEFTRPSSTPEADRLPHEKYVQFADGEMPIVINEPGDKLRLGEESDHIHARLDATGDMAILETRSGNKYVFTRDHVFRYNDKQPDAKLGHSYREPSVGIDVTIGERAILPVRTGSGYRIKETDDDVVAVMLRYTHSAQHDLRATRHFDVESPFPTIQKWVNKFDNR